MTIYAAMLRAAGRRTIYFDAPNEGNPGGTTAPAPTPAPADPTPSPAPAPTPAPADPAPNPAPTPNPAPAPDDKSAELLREVMDKKAKLRDAEAKLKEFDGVDPAEYKALKAAKQKAEQDAAEAAGDFERVKTMMAEQHKTEKAALEAKILELQGDLGTKNGTIDKLTLGNAFANSTFIRDDMVLSPEKTRVVYGTHFEVKDGQVVAYDKPAGAGARTQLVDASGAPLGFDAALKVIVLADPDKDDMMRAKTKPGAASKSDPAPSKPVAPKQELRGRDIIAAGLAKLG